ncbi:MAG: prolipoprotein diacylglyceryl transferase [Bacteroidota bacterium]|jgi:prolipoprotein diacylglyceryl transferase|nr:prolipoprotein diacylglyceryl transferase [Bacteroidota bacterium]
MLDFIVWDVNPEIFSFNLFGREFPIGWYGLLFALGFIVGQQIMFYIFKKDGKPSSDVEMLTMYVVIATVISARLGHFIFYEWDFLLQDPWQWFLRLVIPPYSGLASHGATIGILLALYLYSRKKADQSYLWVVDRVVITVSLGGAFIRLGNLMNSEIYGHPTDVPWAFLFVRETDPALLPVVPRHPTQIYESLFCILLLIITFWLWKKRRHVIPEGFISGVFIILLFTFRFFIEFLKNDQVDFERNIALNMGQILSIPAVIFGIMVMVYAYKKRDYDKPNKKLVRH